jgi:hypothetical protein
LPRTPVIRATSLYTSRPNKRKELGNCRIASAAILTSRKSSIRRLSRPEPLSGGPAAANRLIPSPSRHLATNAATMCRYPGPVGLAQRALATSGALFAAHRADRARSLPSARPTFSR